MEAVLVGADRLVADDADPAHAVEDRPAVPALAPGLPAARCSSCRHGDHPAPRRRCAPGAQLVGASGGQGCAATGPPAALAPRGRAWLALPPTGEDRAGGAMAGLDDLVRLFGPPPPRDVAADDWGEVEDHVGSALPEEFKAFLDAYGTGLICDELVVFHPRGSSPLSRACASWPRSTGSPRTRWSSSSRRIWTNCGSVVRPAFRSSRVSSRSDPPARPSRAAWRAACRADCRGSQRPDGLPRRAWDPKPPAVGLPTPRRPAGRRPRWRGRSRPCAPPPRCAARRARFPGTVRVG